jgi:hypothetical protein
MFYFCTKLILLEKFTHAALVCRSFSIVNVFSIDFASVRGCTIGAATLAVVNVADCATRFSNRRLAGTCVSVVSAQHVQLLP